MMQKDFSNETLDILQGDCSIKEWAAALEGLWLKGEVKSTALITEELKQKLKVVGTDVAVLKTMGKAAGKRAKNDPGKYTDLSCLLWDEFGLEGRIIAAHILSALNPLDPETIFSVSKELLESCVSWVECDNMTYALEPIVRKDPKGYLKCLNSFLSAENKWQKRAALNVLARLPMKQPDYTASALEKVTGCLEFADSDVRRTCSFAIRMAVRGDVDIVKRYISEQIQGTDPNRIWIFSDVIRSMTKSFLREFTGLLPEYRMWLDNTADPRSRKSLEAAIKKLEAVI